MPSRQFLQGDRRHPSPPLVALKAILVERGSMSKANLSWFVPEYVKIVKREKAVGRGRNRRVDIVEEEVYINAYSSYIHHQVVAHCRKHGIPLQRIRSQVG